MKTLNLLVAFLLASFVVSTHAATANIPLLLRQALANCQCAGNRCESRHPVIARRPHCTECGRECRGHELYVQPSCNCGGVGRCNGHFREQLVEVPVRREVCAAPTGTGWQPFPQGSLPTEWYQQTQPNGLVRWVHRNPGSAVASQVQYQHRPQVTSPSCVQPQQLYSDGGAYTVRTVTVTLSSQTTSTTTTTVTTVSRQ